MPKRERPPDMLPRPDRRKKKDEFVIQFRLDGKKPYNVRVNPEELARVARPTLSVQAILGRAEPSKALDKAHGVDHNDDIDHHEGSSPGPPADEAPGPSRRYRVRREERRTLHSNWERLFQLHFPSLCEASLPLTDELPSPCSASCTGRKRERQVVVADLTESYTLFFLSCHDHIVPSLLARRCFPSSPLRPRHGFSFRLLAWVRSIALHTCSGLDNIASVIHDVHRQLNPKAGTISPQSFTTETLSAAFTWFSYFERSRDAWFQSADDSSPPLSTEHQPHAQAGDESSPAHPGHQPHAQAGDESSPPHPTPHHAHNLAADDSSTAPAGLPIPRLAVQDRPERHDGPSLQDLANACPMCFGDLHLHSGPLLPDVVVSIDGNFSHKRKRHEDAQVDAIHHPIRFLGKEAVEEARRQLHRQPNNLTPHECPSVFKAADQAAVSATAAFHDVTGLMMMVCRHDIPLLACDIDTPGERYEYPLALVQAFMDVVSPSVNSVAVFYDIACRFSSSVRNRGLLSEHVQKLRFVIPIFHVYAHGRDCLLHYSPQRTIGMGTSDGEGTERAWAGLAPLIPAERSMGRHRRHQALEDRMGFIADRKLPLAFKILAARAKDVCRQVHEICEDHDKGQWSKKHLERPEWRATRQPYRPLIRSDSRTAWMRFLSWSGDDSFLEMISPKAPSPPTPPPPPDDSSRPEGTDDSSRPEGTDDSSSAPPPSQAPSRLRLPAMLPRQALHGSLSQPHLPLPQRLMTELMGLMLVPLFLDMIELCQREQEKDEALPRASAAEATPALGRPEDTDEARKKRLTAFLQTIEASVPTALIPTTAEIHADTAWQKIWLSAAIALEKTKDLLARKELETERLNRGNGHRLGTRLTSQLRAKAARLSEQIQAQVSAYNDLCKQMALQRPSFRLNLLALKAEDTNLATIWHILDRRAWAGERPQPWHQDAEARAPMLSCLKAARAAEELAMLRREAESALRWLARQYHSVATLWARSLGHPAMRWLIQRRHAWLRYIHSSWYDALGSFTVFTGPFLGLPWPTDISLPNQTRPEDNGGDDSSAAPVLAGDDSSAPAATASAHRTASDSEEEEEVADTLQAGDQWEAQEAEGEEDLAIARWQVDGL